MAAAHVQILIDTRSLDAFVNEITDLVDRRGSLPEFHDLFVDLADSIRSDLHGIAIDGNGVTAAAGDVVVGFELGERLLGCLSAIRTFDREFGVERGHGGLLPC